MQPGQRSEYLYSFVVAAIRHRGPHLPQLTDSTWEELILWASQRRLLGRDPLIRGVGLLWDDPTTTPPDARRYDCAIPIDIEDADLVESPIMVRRTLPFEYLVVRHQGPYDEMKRTYEDALSRHLAFAGLAVVSAPIIEIYRNSPAEVESGDLITDIHIPVVQTGTPA
jgi:AraC family transcriptional regulator